MVRYLNVLRSEKYAQCSSAHKGPSRVETNVFWGAGRQRRVGESFVQPAAHNRSANASGCRIKLDMEPETHCRVEGLFKEPV